MVIAGSIWARFGVEGVDLSIYVYVLGRNPADRFEGMFLDGLDNVGDDGLYDFDKSLLDIFLMARIIDLRRRYHLKIC